jgi:hypothetical protein
MGVVAADQDTKTPLIFVLTTGADPTNLVINYAKEMGQAEGMIAISMVLFNITLRDKGKEELQNKE